MSADLSLLRQLQQSLILQDVYVRQADARIVGEFDPKLEPNPEFGIQIRFIVDTAEHKPDAADATGGGFVRYSLDTGLRFVQKDLDASADPTIIAEITAVFIVDYAARDPSVVTDESLTAFGDNALHHAWPFWREFIHTSSGRLRLPSVILPIRQPLKRPTESATEAPVATSNIITEHIT